MKNIKDKTVKDQCINSITLMMDGYSLEDWTFTFYNIYQVKFFIYFPSISLVNVILACLFAPYVFSATRSLF